MSWQSDLLDKIEQRDIKAVKRLLNKLSLEQLKAPIAFYWWADGTALHCACHKRNPLEIINLILEKLGQYAAQIIAKPNRDSKTPLHLAAKYATAEVTLALLNTLGDQTATVVAMPDRFGMTPLHYAVRTEHSEVVLAMLQALGDQAATLIAMSDNSGWTPLGDAMYGKASPKVILAMLKALGDQAATVVARRYQGATPSNRHGWTSLHYAAQFALPEVTLAMLQVLGKQAAAIIAMPEINGLISLHLATQYAPPEVTLAMLQSLGNQAAAIIATPDKKDSWTSLHYATRYARPEVSLAMLQALGDHVASVVSMCDRNGWTPLHLATRNARPEVTLAMLQALGEQAATVVAMPTKHGFTPLHLAARNDRLEITLALLQILGEQAEVIMTMPDEDGWTPLQFAAQYAKSEVVLAMLQALGDQAATVVATPTKSGWTLLHFAAQNEHPEAVAVMLQALGDQAAVIVAKTDNDGRTPLHLAARDTSPEVALAMLQALGSQAATIIGMSDTAGFNVLHFATSNNKHRGVTPAMLWALGNQAATVAAMTDKEYGWTPLHLAACVNHLTAIRYLLLVGANHQTKTKDGKTALRIAKEIGHYWVISYLESFKQPLPEHIRIDQETYLIVRVWTPQVNNKDAHIVSALTKRHTDTNVGHASLAIYQPGKRMVYISHWPKTDTFGKAISNNNSLIEDLAAEKSLPRIQILYSLDIAKILSHYKVMKQKKFEWSLYGTAKNTLNLEDDKSRVHSCSSLVYELLEIGGLFQYLLKDTEKVINIRPITPLKVGELAQKARAVEDILYSETNDYADNFLACYGNQLIELAQEGSTKLWQFLKSAPDLLWLYAKQYGEQGMRSLIQALEIILPRTNAYALFVNVKEANEETPTFAGSNLIAFLRDMINGLNLQLQPLLAQLGYIEISKQEQTKLIPLFNHSKNNDKDKTIYNETFITQNAHFYRTLIKPFLDTFILLVNRKVDVSWKDENGYNAIHWAVINNSNMILKLLLSHFPEAVNEATFMSSTPLDLAIQYNHLSIITTLKEAGGLTYNQLKEPNHKNHAPVATLISTQQGRDKLFHFHKNISKNQNQENLPKDTVVDKRLSTAHEEVYLSKNTVLRS